MAEITEFVDYVQRVGNEAVDVITPHAANVVTPHALSVPTLDDRLVEFAHQGSALLPATEPGFSVLRQTLRMLKSAESVVYAQVEDDGQTKNILDVLMPISGRVVAVVPTPDGGREVQLSESCTRHFVPPGHRHFHPLVEALQKAARERVPMSVTSTGDPHVVIDVRPVPPPGAPMPPAPWWPVVGEEAIKLTSMTTRTEATTKFNKVKAKSECQLPLGMPGCVPFLYPDDYCWAKADRLCTLLAEEELHVGKIWAHGRLRVRTANHPCCAVGFYWHVAPFVRSRGTNFAEILVFDPTFFDFPVSRANWKAALGDEHARLSYTDVSVYRQAEEGEYVERPDGHPDNDLARGLARLFRRVRGWRPRPPFKDCG
jgi:hypothetical protein